MRINNTDYNLRVPAEAKKYLQLLVVEKFSKFPFFTNLLLNLSDIEDVHPENKKTALAYTYFDHEYERVKIRINFDMIEDGMKSKSGKTIYFNNNSVLFLLYHELLHNYFLHFSRFEDYQKDYPELTNIVLDFYCNEFLFRMLGMKPEQIMDKEFRMITYDELNKISIASNKVALPFSTYDEKPLEKEVIEFFLQHKNEWPKSPSFGSGAKMSGDKSGKGEESESDGSGPGADGDTEESGGSGGSEKNDGSKEINQDDHGLADKYTNKSLDELNKKREAAGKSKISKNEADQMASKKIDTASSEAASMSSGISTGEADLMRHKMKILKKDPFLSYVKIKNTLKKMASREYYKTYSKPNRKKQHVKDIVYKGRTKESGLHIVVGVDVSGSVSDAELQTIYNMLGTFMDKNSKETSIDIFYWSSCEIKKDIHFHKDITSAKELLKLKVNSSGGTILKTVHDFLDKQYKGKKICFLNITDGFFENATLPEVVTDYYFCLTVNGMEDSIRKWYPKAKTKVCRIDG